MFSLASGKNFATKKKNTKHKTTRIIERRMWRFPVSAAEVPCTPSEDDSWAISKPTSAAFKALADNSCLILTRKLLLLNVFVRSRAVDAFHVLFAVCLMCVCVCVWVFGCAVCVWCVNV